jgi:7-cyano-7-deazaguanine reductase
MLSDLKRTIQSSAPLGQKTIYPDHYDKSLLYPVMRATQRKAMNLPELVPFGFDVWNAHELFWHNLKGKPIRAYGTFYVPANSLNLWESKSVKLYLNSLNHKKFSDKEEVEHLLIKDLSEICQSKVKVYITHENPKQIPCFLSSEYRCLDEIDVELGIYERRPELLKVDENHITHEKLVSHLFKSHCLCTGQPDFGSIFIEYRGPKIDDAGLLAYLVSYSKDVGFGENCVEQIFCDLIERARPQGLIVFGCFAIRGGIAINPYRSSYEVSFDEAQKLAMVNVSSG